MKFIFCRAPEKNEDSEETGKNVPNDKSEKEPAKVSLGEGRALGCVVCVVSFSVYCVLSIFQTQNLNGNQIRKDGWSVQFI